LLNDHLTELSTIYLLVFFDPCKAISDFHYQKLLINGKYCMPFANYNTCQIV